MQTEIASMLIAPSIPFVAAFGMRYLFATFLRQSASCFADLAIPSKASVVIGTRMAVQNCVIYAIAALLFAGFAVLHLPALIIAAPGVLGILIAIAATIRIAAGSLGIDLLTAGLIGLVSCAGGSLPLIILYPAILAITTII